MVSSLLPEFFALLAIDLFLLLSLLTCLLDDRLPKTIAYVYQIAALIGYGHLLISKEFFAVFGEYMRFWYCFIYLLVALVNIVAINVYLAVQKKLWTLAKVWSGAVTFPTLVISLFFLSNYGYLQVAAFPLLFLQISLVVSVIVMGISIGIFLSPESVRTLFRSRKEVK
jgi:hypothetical protein